LHASRVKVRAVSFTQYLGTYVTLVIRRFGSPGAFLAFDEPSHEEGRQEPAHVARVIGSEFAPSESPANALLSSNGNGGSRAARENAHDRDSAGELYRALEIFEAPERTSESARPEREPVILLPGGEIPEGALVGDALDVFIYLDSEGRPVSTLKRPRIALGTVAFLTVTARTAVGAFVDWGLGKELLVPFAEQTRELEVGERHPIGLYVDASGRLAGTMKVREFLHKTPPAFAAGTWVDGEAWRNESDSQVGLFVIIEHTHIGLVPYDEPHRLSRGEAASFRVTRLLPDGKVLLSLRALAHEERDGDAARILEALQSSTPPKVGDKSDPEEIRSLFGLSKKAFKRAVGGLLKQGKVSIDNQGFVTVAASPEPPKVAPRPNKR
jgi:uncharacterized protein